MDGIEEKLGSILANPQLMQQIMTMAQSLGGEGSSTPPREPAREPPKAPVPVQGLDPALIKGLGSLAGQGRVDGNQQALLRALGPYLSRGRVAKLEKAMRAARIAQMASALLNSGALSSLIGR